MGGARHPIGLCGLVLALLACLALITHEVISSSTRSDDPEFSPFAPAARAAPYPGRRSPPPLHRSHLDGLWLAKGRVVASSPDLSASALIRWTARPWSRPNPMAPPEPPAQSM